MKKVNLLLAVTMLMVVLSSCNFGACDFMLRAGLRPDKPAITAGETITLTPYDESCGASGKIPPLVWTSEEPEVASVERNTGKVTGVSEGTAFILAEPVDEEEPFSGNALVTVTPP